MNRIKIALAQNGTFIALLVMIIFFASMNPRFLSLANGQTILLQIAELGIIALPLAFLVMSGTLDLSVGSVASLSAVVSAMVMIETNSALWGFAAAIVVGVITGALNGLLVAYLKLNPLVITLGFLSVWGGLALFLTQGSTLVGFPDSFKALGTMTVGPVPLQIIILAVGVFLAWYVLNRNSLGRNVLAIGGNPRAAHLMGIRVPRTIFSLFVATGVAAAISGTLLAAKLQSAPPTVGNGMEIQALTVVLLGGVALEGGMGRITGVVSGLLFVGVLRNGLVIMGVSQFLQTILIGATLVVAVLLDGSVQRLLKKSWTTLDVKKTPKSDKAKTEVAA
ncbi:ribose transport system permease protein/inositol transport system permease protein/inositol transport system permease protein [Salinibacterium amurskyense]|uniref:Ribose transport system permease protein/inositol transport system permease protein/inositol transport system permease protein n=1 Tax=Salinibacterium amurskyense TaxID=205941 RepID=A0A2M9D686_9MICO|nr:ABC transporter permease [Salinibacterium amurskyense]PJJ81033.1 ribose transport system permease protein/inositol transport system permease protein/inositol transport system permease protein [Salinibacterium amurskyense]RLQ83064.1 ABC transporter permease [Salinibacterium amurskyense]GHD81775.1 sugar ABC transporter permease [Salinibacterium amurskyense]